MSERNPDRSATPTDGKNSGISRPPAGRYRHRQTGATAPHRSGDMVRLPPPLAPLLRTTFAAARLGELTDGELLARYVATRDGEAFAELVRRLGPTVYGVCRRVLGSAEDAEDAFQVTFLVLARKAGTIHPPGRVAAWLHRVAALAARKARTARGRRRVHEMATAPPVATSASPEPDLGGVIDEELNRLPERLRLPITLCEVRGLTVAQAARELGWPVGTVASRLSRGRDMLAARLARRGLVVGAVGGWAAYAAPPSRLVADILSLTAPSGGVPSGATSLLLNEVTRAMTVMKVRLLVAGLFAAAVTGLTAGTGVLVPAAAAPPAPPGAPAPSETGLDRVPLRNLPALLSSEAVHEELNLTDEQKKVVVKARADTLENAKGEFKKGVVAPPKPQPKPGETVVVRADLQEMEEQVIRAFDKTVVNALKPEQARRLKQISLQAMGPAALLDRRVARELGLTAEQEDKIEAGLPLRSRSLTDETKADAAWAAAVKVLTAEQQKKWGDMTGKMLPTKDLLSITNWEGLKLEKELFRPAHGGQPPPPPGNGGKPGG